MTYTLKMFGPQSAHSCIISTGLCKLQILNFLHIKEKVLLRSGSTAPLVVRSEVTRTLPTSLLSQIWTWNLELWVPDHNSQSQSKCILSENRWYRACPYKFLLLVCKICGRRSSVKIKSCAFLQRFWVWENMGLVNLGNQGEFLRQECTSVWFHTDTSATTQILLHFDMLYKSCMWNENCGAPAQFV